MIKWIKVLLKKKKIEIEKKSLDINQGLLILFLLAAISRSTSKTNIPSIEITKISDSNDKEYTSIDYDNDHEVIYILEADKELIPIFHRWRVKAI